MIEELGLIDHYRDSRGMSCLSPEAGITVLERVLGLERAQILVATVVNSAPLPGVVSDHSTAGVGRRST